ncbi:MAG: polysaccharide biosynthesis/export family protein [Nitrospiraceae bacterium]|nr:polysaccharide biosynthesis/export family protein [Nitrospiraceae bacterium]
MKSLAAQILSLLVLCALSIRSQAQEKPVPRALPVDQPANSPAAGLHPLSAPDPAGSSAAPAEAKSETAPSERAILPRSMDGLNDKRAIAVGDKLSFSVVEDEAPPVPLYVTDSGEMEVPYIGRLTATEKTCKQLAYRIKALLEKEYYYQATVLLGLDTAGSRVSSRGRVYVVGQVRAQGPQDIPVDEVWTVSKAVLRAGGFATYANRRKVKLVRGGTGQGKTETVIVDLVEVLEKGDNRKDHEVGPDDLIVVPEKLINF